MSVARDRDSESRGCRVCLVVSGLSCAGETASIERRLSALDGVRRATISPLRDRVYVDVERLVQVEGVVERLEHLGHPVDSGLLQVTTWIAGSAERLDQLRERLLALNHVVYCHAFGPTGRLDLGLELRGEWKIAAHEICRLLCQAAGEREPILPADQAAARSPEITPTRREGGMRTP